MPNTRQIDKAKPLPSSEKTPPPQNIAIYAAIITALAAIIVAIINTTIPPLITTQQTIQAKTDQAMQTTEAAQLLVIPTLTTITLITPSQNLVYSATPESLLTETTTPVSTFTPTITITPIPTITISPSITVSSTASEALLPGATRISPIDGAEQVFVPKGSFIMGASDIDTAAKPNEYPAHEVYLDDFWIDQYEVTNYQYKKCVNNGGCTEPVITSARGINNYYVSPSYLLYSVVNVSWFDAVQYCKWAGRRLPTEAEWEKAARGTDRRIYPWGNGSSTETAEGVRANYCDGSCGTDWSDKSVNDNYHGISPKAEYPAGKSPYGAYDMAGNVWEWVSDWYNHKYYQAYPSGVTNPQGLDVGNTKVVRGGSFMNEIYALRSSYRYSYEPSDINDIVGFRCVSSQ